MNMLGRYRAFPMGSDIDRRGVDRRRKVRQDPDEKGEEELIEFLNSRAETDKTNGTAHFLEHLAFKVCI